VYFSNLPSLIFPHSKFFPIPPDPSPKDIHINFLL
jgi:hypothetical protein